MKKLSWLLILAMLASVFAFTASAEVTYSQSPMLDEAVASGALPPVEERLPEVTKLPDEILPEFLEYETGNYGGTLRLATSVVNWDADGFVGQNEALLTMESANSGVITPNIVESYEANEDNTVYTFTLRKGLKWSDGTPVTMADFEFGVNSFVFNEELVPVVGSWMRDGGRSDGQPMKFDVVDDWTFTISFNETYGGFPVHLSIAGWKGYTEFLKPAHFLKQFHLEHAEEVHGSLDAYYEFIRPFAAQMAYDDPTEEGVWAYVFHQVDMTNWELTDPNDALTSKYFAGLIDTNVPVLFPYVMQSSDGGITTWARNPYYHKVDADGQQLPYIDYITSTLVENMEMVQLHYMTGEADFGRESATIDNISLYRENEAAAGITAYVTAMHVNPTDVAINVNYGLNTDGTVKDDPDSQAWQEVVPDLRFRQALMLAIDAEEILDAVYKGFGEIHPDFECTGDIDAANALLDEMGMVDVNGDGYRETPSGLPLQWQIWNSAEANDIIPVCELLVEFWAEIGLKVGVNTTESTLRDTAREANEIPMRVAWVHSAQLWHYRDWFVGNWAPLYQDWLDRGGLSGVLDGSTEFLEPDESFKQFVLSIESLFTENPETAVGEVLPTITDWIADTLYLIEPLINVQQCVIINSDIGNVPTGGAGISWNFSMEQFFFRSFEY